MRGEAGQRAGANSHESKRIVANSDGRDSAERCDSIEVFVSYSREDDQYRVRLETHLKLLMRQGVISAWKDRDIALGEEWLPEILDHLESARIILLLVSSDFLASDFIWEQELKRAMERHHAGEARVIPVMVRQCDWQSTPFAKLQGLPRGLKPVAQWKDADSAWTEVARGIREVAEMLRRNATDGDASVQAGRRGERRDDALQVRLAELVQRRDNLRARGTTTEKLDAQIVQLRRRLRRGVPEEEWELSDRYVMLEELGRGGFARVWKAHDQKTDELVAIKVMHPHLAGDSLRLERFFRGARIMIELGHPNVVRVREPHGEEAGYHYFVMELMEGGNLRDAVRERRLSRDEAVARVVEVGEALAIAHDRKYVHRDVKPQNILLTAALEAKLSDFDLVGAGDTTGGTHTGALGSYAYAAPECLTRPQEARATADVYSLAMTLIYALTGQDPNPRTMDRSLPRLPCGAAMRAVLRRAASVEPEQRQLNARELVREIREAQRRKVVRRLWAEAFEEDEHGSVATIRLPGGVRRGVRLRLRWIPPGRFRMGSTETEEERDEDERQHEVVLKEGYWLGETVCTQDQWQAVMGENPSRFKNETESLQHPVERVSWQDCMEFLARLNRKISGLELRLPTEAEWERACRAGTVTPFSFGENVTPQQVNYDGSRPYADGTEGRRRGRTVPVKELGPNAWGLYQMHGNVAEWCADWFGEYEGEVAVDPKGPKTGDQRVVRGGSWFSGSGSARSACRFAGGPHLRNDYVGFRVARGR